MDLVKEWERSWESRKERAMAPVMIRV